MLDAYDAAFALQQGCNRAIKCVIETGVGGRVSSGGHGDLVVARKRRVLSRLASSLMQVARVPGGGVLGVRHAVHEWRRELPSRGSVGTNNVAA